MEREVSIFFFHNEKEISLDLKPQIQCKKKKEIRALLICRWNENMKIWKWNLLWYNYMTEIFIK